MTEQLGSRITRLVDDLRQVQVGLLREMIGVDQHTDPTGILRAAYGEVSKQVHTAAISLAGLNALVDVETTRVAAANSKRQFDLARTVGEVGSP